MPWCHSGSAINYVRFREIQMQKLGFWVSTSRCQSAVPTVSPPPTITTPSAPPETTFPGCLFHWKKLDVRSQAHQQLGSVSVCRGASLEQVWVKGGGVSWVHQQTVRRHKPPGPFRSFLSMTRSIRKVQRILIWFETCSKHKLQRFPFYLEWVAEHSHQPAHLHV